MLIIDGSFGEGGGQIIRSSLALALVTGKPFRAERVRANRDKPGLKQQHLTAVKAAAEIGGAVVEGAAVGAREFAFSPGVVAPGDYVFRIGTAGSTTLVLQTILPPLIIAPGPSTIRIEGGTHNPHAPPFDFLEKTFLPLVNRIGPGVTIELERYGFYPPGGGALNVLIEPSAEFRRLDLLERGLTRPPRARALVVNLPPGIAERELSLIKERTGWGDEQLIVETSNNAISPGNVLMIEIESEHLTEVVSRIGERGVRAEIVAEKALDEALSYLDADAPVGGRLADQLLIPLALGAGGSFLTGPLSLHTTTNIEIVKMFLGTEIAVTPTAAGTWRVDVGART